MDLSQNSHFLSLYIDLGTAAWVIGRVAVLSLIGNLFRPDAGQDGFHRTF